MTKKELGKGGGGGGGGGGEGGKNCFKLVRVLLSLV